MPDTAMIIIGCAVVFGVIIAIMVWRGNIQSGRLVFTRKGADAAFEKSPDKHTATVTNVTAKGDQVSVTAEGEGSHVRDVKTDGRGINIKAKT